MKNQYRHIYDIAVSLGADHSELTRPVTAYRTPTGKVVHLHDSCRLFRTGAVRVSVAVDPTKPEEAAELPKGSSICRECWQNLSPDLFTYSSGILRLSRVAGTHRHLLETKAPWEHYAEHYRYAHELQELVPHLVDPSVAQAALDLCSKAREQGQKLEAEQSKTGLDPLLEWVAAEMVPRMEVADTDPAYLFGRAARSLGTDLTRQVLVSLSKGAGLDQAITDARREIEEFVARGPQEVSQLPDSGLIPSEMSAKQAVLAQWCHETSSTVDAILARYRGEVLDKVAAFENAPEAVVLVNNAGPTSHIVQSISWLLVPFGMKYCRASENTALIRVPALVAALFQTVVHISETSYIPLGSSSVYRNIERLSPWVFPNMEPTPAELEAVAVLYEPSTDQNEARAELELLLSSAAALS